MIIRTLETSVDTILKEYNKMLFVSGPRQVGKTTLAKEYQKKNFNGYYFNWDIFDDQKSLLNDPYFFQKFDRDFKSQFLLIFDEIHKYKLWKSYLKGAYDKFHDDFLFFITGSGRLDLFKKGGESLLGRYFSLVLHPLTLGELAHAPISFDRFKSMMESPDEASGEIREAYKHLFEFSGFPEPFVRGKKAFYAMWARERKKLLIKEDIRDASNIRDISLLDTLSQIVPEKVGSPLSINSLRQDVSVAFETIRDWMILFNQFYYIFQIYPYTASLRRSLKKEPKMYLYDWGEIDDEGIRFENMVALHLFKAVSLWSALGQGTLELRYLRDKDKREVDFLILENKKPLCLIECKASDVTPSPHLMYYQEKLNISTAIQLVHKSGISRKIKGDKGNCFVFSADDWLSILP